MQHIEINLPPLASDVYYRDYIGNVSSSNFRSSKISQSKLHLEPRYPLLGGWTYSWYHGYNLPLNKWVNVGGDKYTVKVPLIESFNSIPIEELIFRVILPEGAK